MMRCELYFDSINDLVDGVLDGEARAALQAHLATCDPCRALFDDLRAIRRESASLDRKEIPPRVWQAIAQSLPENRPATASPSRLWDARSWLAAAALLAIALGAFWIVRAVLIDPTAEPPASAAGGSAAAESEGELLTVENELRLAEEHYQRAIEGLETIAADQQGELDPQVAETLQKNLGVIDQAIEESRAALAAQPTSRVAQESLFEAFRRKVALLQDTIALVNEMRKGDEAGAARIVEGLYQ